MVPIVSSAGGGLFVIPESLIAHEGSISRVEPLIYPTIYPSDPLKSLGILLAVRCSAWIGVCCRVNFYLGPRLTNSAKLR